MSPPSEYYDLANQLWILAVGGSQSPYRCATRLADSSVPLERAQNGRRARPAPGGLSVTVATYRPRKSTFAGRQQNDTGECHNGKKGKSQNKMNRLNLEHGEPASRVAGDVHAVTMRPCQRSIHRPAALRQTSFSQSWGADGIDNQPLPNLSEPVIVKHTGIAQKATDRLV